VEALETPVSRASSLKAVEETAYASSVACRFGVRSNCLGRLGAITFGHFVQKPHLDGILKLTVLLWVLLDLAKALGDRLGKNVRRLLNVDVGCPASAPVRQI